MHFTYVSLLVWLVSMLDPQWTGVSKSLTVGVAVSFSCAPLVDADAYLKLRQKMNWSLLTFWCGNVVLHFVPYLFVRDCSVSWFDSSLAACTHLVWIYFASNGTWCLDEVYVPLRGRHSWTILCTVAIVSEFLLV